MSYIHLICCLYPFICNLLTIFTGDDCTHIQKITLVFNATRLLFVCLSVACYYFVFIHHACVSVCFLFCLSIMHHRSVFDYCVEIACVNTIFSRVSSWWIKVILYAQKSCCSLIPHFIEIVSYERENEKIKGEKKNYICSFIYPEIDWTQLVTPWKKKTI